MISALTGLCTWSLASSLWELLFNLGPRIGRFAADGTPQVILGHNAPMSTIGLMMIIVRFFGFLGGCIIYAGGAQWTTIFGTPVSLSAISFNTLMGFTAGVVLPKVDAFITRKFKLDDAVGAFAVHGIGGLIGVVGFGLFSGFPNMAGPDITSLGQIKSAVVMALLGFIPGYGLSLILVKMGILRVPAKAEIAGLDLVEVPLSAYPKGFPASSAPAEFNLPINDLKPFC